MQKSKDNKGAMHEVSCFTDYDIHLFREGNHFRLYDKLGSRLLTIDGTEGTYFAVWAPNAKSIPVTGDFNKWDADAHHLSARLDGSGIWEGFIRGGGQIAVKLPPLGIVFLKNSGTPPDEGEE
jgi:1,4-alpha-glucan branching enzyme